MTPEEQRARLTELDTYMKVSLGHKQRGKFIEYVVSHYTRLYRLGKTGNIISYQDRMCDAIMHMGDVDGIVRLGEYSNLIKWLKREDDKQVVILLGECLEKCGMLRDVRSIDSVSVI